MDILSQIRKPVAEDLARYERLFDTVLDHEDDFLGRALQYVRSRKGKMMRPLLVLLIARECGAIGEKALHSAVTLELLHTASLVHDDVVDESNERRGQASVNAVYGNQISVLVGDYLLSKSLQEAAFTGSLRIVDIISRLGGTLSEGEIFQIANIRSEQISEEAYFRIIDHKTAALFAACAELGALSADAGEDFIEKAIKEAEDACYSTCEECGNSIGTNYSPRCETLGWITYICERCAKKRGVKYRKGNDIYKNGEFIEAVKKPEYSERSEDGC